MAEERTATAGEVPRQDGIRPQDRTGDLLRDEGSGKPIEDQPGSGLQGLRLGKVDRFKRGQDARQEVIQFDKSPVGRRGDVKAIRDRKASFHQLGQGRALSSDDIQACLRSG